MHIIPESERTTWNKDTKKSQPKMAGDGVVTGIQKGGKPIMVTRNTFPDLRGAKFELMLRIFDCPTKRRENIIDKF